jgi:hypothetical protein
MSPEFAPTAYTVRLRKPWLRLGIYVKNSVTVSSCPHAAAALFGPPRASSAAKPAQIGNRKRASA